MCSLISPVFELNGVTLSLVLKKIIWFIAFFVTKKVVINLFPVYTGIGLKSFNPGPRQIPEEQTPV